MGFMISCDNDEDAIATFNALVDVSGSSLLEDSKYSIGTMFSTDGGATFTDFPVVKRGDTYLVKAVDGGMDVTEENCFNVDWSASDPQPNSVTGGVAEFTMGEDGSLIAKVTDFPYNAGMWAGDISAVESYASGPYGPYTIKLTQSSTNVNRYDLNNFYDSGLSAYIVFVPEAHTVSFPNGQTPGGKPITASTGVFDACAGTFDIHLTYDGATWDYHFTK
jgi:hypothetical protein